MGLLWRRRGGEAWTAAGLAAGALLAAALVLPDGVPSQAGLLQRFAPWAHQQQAPPLPANPHLLDVTHQVEPWLLFLRHELRSGRLPFWNPHQLSGEPFWANGSSAPLFPLHLLFPLLPVHLGLLLMPWLRLAIGGCGAAALARQLGLSPRAALVAAVVYPLSGTVVSFLLFPMANTHALIPWVLWSVERLAAGRGSWVALALTAGLQLLGGHPETAVFTGLLATVYLLVRCPPPLSRPLLATWGRFAGGWVAAGALSAVQTVPLAAMIFSSSKWLHWQEPLPIPWRLRGELLLRAVVPHPFGSATAGTWWGPFNDPATAIYAGAATLPLALAGLALVRDDRRWRGVAAFTLFAVLAAYHFPLVRELLLALPLVSHGLHHYLKVGLELGLALLAAAGWDRWLGGAGHRALRAGGLASLALVVATTALFLGRWQERLQLAAQLPWLALAAATGLAALALPLLRASRRPRWWWTVPLLLALELAIAHGTINPAVSAAAVYPPTPAIEQLRTLQRRPATVPGTRLAGTGSTLRPDAAMVYRLEDARGDAPLKLERYQQLYGRLAPFDPVYFRPIERWQHPWLDLLGVGLVVGAPGETAPDPRWRLLHDGHDARVWERPGALPLVRWERPSDAPLRVVERAPGRWRLRWQAPQAQRLVVAETWDPGWRARVGEGALPVRAWRGVLLAVDLPAGSGELDLRYRPQWLPAGAALSLLAALACGAGTLHRRWWRRRPAAAALEARAREATTLDHRSAGGDRPSPVPSAPR